MCVTWYLIVVLTCIFLMISGVEHLVCSLTFCITSEEKCLFQITSSPHSVSQRRLFPITLLDFWIWVFLFPTWHCSLDLLNTLFLSICSAADPELTAGIAKIGKVWSLSWGYGRVLGKAGRENQFCAKDVHGSRGHGRGLSDCAECLEKWPMEKMLQLHLEEWGRANMMGEGTEAEKSMCKTVR